MSFTAATLHAALEASVPAEAAGLVVALSGGPDSAALLGAAAALRLNFRALPLRAVHIDHGLQASAAEFRASCEALCERLRIPLHIVTVEVQRGSSQSIEAAARAARYAAIAAQMLPLECLLTAHHREDQAETLLLQALRGAGVKGMAAMPVCRPFGPGWHVRPLLEVARGELLELGAQLDARGSIDPMNKDLRFDRVYLRAAVWPLIDRRWPGAAIVLSRAARHLAEAQQLLDLAAGADVGRLRDGDALSIPALRALPPLRRINAVRLWLSQAGLEPPPTARLVEALRQVFDAEADHQPAVVWGSNALRRYRQRLFVADAEPPRLLDPRPWVGALGTPIELGPRLGNLTWIARPGGIDAGRLPAALIVRRRDGGETLRPAPHAKTQTVQHLCQSLGVLPWMRDSLPLVFAGHELIAVADLWLDAGWCAAAGAPGLGLAWNNAPLVT
ncbi:MAG TPA: tRNA lysidine(34) synthetase TilS [Steroidobacteraceae bacterium]|nr:tRNA lysidine(34) synthetase TilS [Steroidobacteraceae bacterium]